VRVPLEAGWHVVQRRQRLHERRQLSGRRLHRREPDLLRGARSVPRRRNLRPGDRPLLAPGEGQRETRAATATPARRSTRARPEPARDRLPCSVPAALDLSRSAELRPRDRAMRRLAEARWDGVQRFESVHDRRCVPERILPAERQRHLPGAHRFLSGQPHVQHRHGCLRLSDGAGRRGVRRSQPVHARRSVSGRRLPAGDPIRLPADGGGSVPPDDQRLQSGERPVRSAPGGRRYGV
jgi:hypothetical protein